MRPAPARIGDRNVRGSGLRGGDGVVTNLINLRNANADSARHRIDDPLVGKIMRVSRVRCRVIVGSKLGEGQDVIGFAAGSVRSTGAITAARCHITRQEPSCGRGAHIVETDRDGCTEVQDGKLFVGGKVRRGGCPEAAGDGTMTVAGRLGAILPEIGVERRCIGIGTARGTGDCRTDGEAVCLNPSGQCLAGSTEFHVTRRCHCRWIDRRSATASPTSGADDERIRIDLDDATAVGEADVNTSGSKIKHGHSPARIQHQGPWIGDGEGHVLKRILWRCHSSDLIEK